MSNTDRGRYERSELTKTRQRIAHKKNKVDRIKRLLTETQQEVQHLQEIEKQLQKEEA